MLAPMRLDHVLKDLGIPDSHETFRSHWAESVAALGAELPWFLAPVEVSAARAYSGLPETAEGALQTEAQRVLAHSGLRLLAWHCHRLLYDHPEYEQSRDWPHSLGGVFYLLVTLGMVRRVREAHAAMGVEDAITRATCSQLACFAANYAGMVHGELGIPVSQLFWTSHYPACRLFRLGRMEYMIRPFIGGVVVYRNDVTGEVLALAPDGVPFTTEGYAAWEGVPSWRASLAEEPDVVSGYPVSPEGRAVRHAVSLNRPPWRRVLGPGDATLDMHIPAGGRMGLEACGDSMRQADAFFRRYFPDRPCLATSCYSWIFNTQLERIPMTSDHLVRFQRELYLFPVPSNGRDGLWFIFLTDQVDPRTAPRDTSLRRGVADFLATGERWRSGAMFYLLEDLGAFGTQPYRSRWPPRDLVLP